MTCDQQQEGRQTPVCEEGVLEKQPPVQPEEPHWTWREKGWEAL